MNELKPCPFCGGSAHVATAKTITRLRFTVSCANTDCIAHNLGNPFVTHYSTEHEAVAKWNKRTFL